MPAPLVLLALSVAFFGTLLSSLALGRPHRVGFLTAFAVFVVILIFVTTRHIQIIRRRLTARAKSGCSNSPARRRPDDYYLFVLGSGGHTKEMLMMMNDGYCDFARFHRRYLLSTGDRISRHDLESYEKQLDRMCLAADKLSGTFDVRVVTRARSVHQSHWKIPFTILLSFIDIITTLYSPPRNEVGQKLRYPSQIFSNGPATGFLVGLAVHLLKIFFLVPQDSMNFIYIESWARISTLSLTGKLLYYMGIADLLYVQHSAVATKYGLVNAGEMIFNSMRPQVSRSGKLS